MTEWHGSAGCWSGSSGPSLAGLGSVTDVSLRIDDICVIWTEILGRQVGAVPRDGPFVRFAEACFVLLGEPRMTREAIRAAGRRWHTGPAESVTVALAPHGQRQSF